uniref:Uncharacterized protein n=1 Tax=Arundo donax TaxID=35708 RepID=A0A0A9HPE0_ARUDO
MCGNAISNFCRSEQEKQTLDIAEVCNRIQKHTRECYVPFFKAE